MQGGLQVTSRNKSDTSISHQCACHTRVSCALWWGAACTLRTRHHSKHLRISEGTVAACNALRAPLGHTHPRYTLGHIHTRHTLGHSHRQWGQVSDVHGVSLGASLVYGCVVRVVVVVVVVVMIWLVIRVGILDTGSLNHTSITTRVCLSLSQSQAASWIKEAYYDTQRFWIWFHDAH